MSGESGGTSRPMTPSVILCDLVAERVRVIQEFLSTREYAKEGVSAFDTPSFVHTVYPIFKVHSSDFFSNIFFFQRPLTRGEEIPVFASRFLACLDYPNIPAP